MQSSSKSVVGTSFAILLCLTLFVLPKGFGQEVADSGTTIKVVVYGEDAFWILPGNKSDGVKPRFLDGEGLLAEIEGIKKRVGEEVSVIVSAKRSTPTSRVAAAMDACQRAGVKNVSLSISREEGGEVAASEVAIEAVAEIAAPDEGKREKAANRVKGGTRVAAGVEGRVVAIGVRKGDEVKKGQVLLEFDPTEQELFLRMAEAKIQSTKADVEISEASHHLARRSFELVEKMAKGGTVSELELARAEFNLRSTEAEREKKLAALKIAEAEANLMKIYLDRCRVHAPRNGTVTTVEVQEGELVAKGQVVVRIDPAD